MQDLSDSVFLSIFFQVDHVALAVCRQNALSVACDSATPGPSKEADFVSSNPHAPGAGFWATIYWHSLLLMAAAGTVLAAAVNVCILFPWHKRRRNTENRQSHLLGPQKSSVRWWWTRATTSIAPV